MQSDPHPDPVGNTKIKQKLLFKGLSLSVGQRRLTPIMADIAVDTLKILAVSRPRVIHGIAAEVGLFLKSIDEIHLHFLFLHQLAFY